MTYILIFDKLKGCTSFTTQTDRVNFQTVVNFQRTLTEMLLVYILSNLKAANATMFYAISY